jgi:hypothetical protein
LRWTVGSVPAIGGHDPSPSKLFFFLSARHREGSKDGGSKSFLTTHRVLQDITLLEKKSVQRSCLLEHMYMSNWRGAIGQAFSRASCRGKNGDIC